MNLSTIQLETFFYNMININKIKDGTSTSIFNKASKTRTKVVHNNISKGFKIISFLALIKLD